MATEAQVKEIDLLRTYASRLYAFKDATMGDCAAMKDKADSILDHVRNTANTIESEFFQSQDMANDIIRKFEQIVKSYQLTAENSILLGPTADDAKAKIDVLSYCVTEIKDKIERIKSLVLVLQEKANIYAQTVSGMSEDACNQLRKRCDILEKYKET